MLELSRSDAGCQLQIYNLKFEIGGSGPITQLLNYPITQLS
jgi:hypothetical protein